MDSSEKLVKDLIDSGYLKTPQIIEAFQKIDRRDFVLERFKKDAYVNSPLPIGYGQTISQPQTVAFMLELLRPEKGNRIMDIGSGSGWQSALLAEIVGIEGKVIALELLPELREFGEKNASKYNFAAEGILKFICADGTKGLPEKAPFDRIIVAASGQNVPMALKNQLKIGGRLVIPIRNSIWQIVKTGEDEFEEREYPGFAFVPLIMK